MFSEVKWRDIHNHKSVSSRSLFALYIAFPHIISVGEGAMPKCTNKPPLSSYSTNCGREKCKNKINRPTYLVLPVRSLVHSGGGIAPLLAPQPLLSFSSSQLPELRTDPAQASLWSGRPTPSGSWPSASPTQASFSPSSLQWHWTGSRRTGRGHAGQRSSSKASCAWHSLGGVWGGGTSLEVAASGGSPREAAAGSWWVWRWSGGQSGPAQRKHWSCCERPAWRCWGWSPRLGCTERGWCQISKTEDEDVRA